MFNRYVSQTLMSAGLLLTRSLSLLGACLAISLAVGCASVDTSAARWDEAKAAPEAEVLEAQPAMKEPSGSDKDSRAKADAMMASLKAPLEAPKEKAKEEIKEEVKAEVKEKAKARPQEGVNVESDMEGREELIAQQVAALEVKPALEEAVDKTKTEAKPSSPNEIKVPVNKAPKKPLQSTAKALSISENDLPASYDIWVLRQGDTPLTQGLVISTPTWEMGKEGYMSQIWLTLKENEVHVNSSSDIATEAQHLGLRIDGGDLIPFTRIAENNIAILEGEWLDKLAAANKLDIFLGFFPDKKPRSDTFHSDTSLESLDRVVATYRKLSH